MKQELPNFFSLTKVQKKRDFLSVGRDSEGRVGFIIFFGEGGLKAVVVKVWSQAITWWICELLCPTLELLNQKFCDGVQQSVF